MTRSWHRWVPPGDDGGMAGAFIIVIVCVAVIPVGVLMSGGVASGLLGFFLKSEADKANADSELLETNY